MKSTVAILSSWLAFSATSLAQFNVQSRPFTLVAKSHEHKYNGTAFTACHEGAGIEALCAGLPANETNAQYESFNFNTSSTLTGYQNNSIGAVGILTWELRSNINTSTPLTLYPDPSSNVALPLFEPGYDYQLVSFDDKNRLLIQSSLDDTAKPHPVFLESPQALYRWYICETYYEGYVYETLSWVYGRYPPQNPTCAKVEVVRVFL